MNTLAEIEDEIKVPCPECGGDPYQEYIVGDELYEKACTYCNHAGFISPADVEVHPYINYYRAIWAAQNLEVAA